MINFNQENIASHFLNVYPKFSTACYFFQEIVLREVKENKL